MSSKMQRSKRERHLLQYLSSSNETWVWDQLVFIRGCSNNMAIEVSLGWNSVAIYRNFVYVMNPRCLNNLTYVALTCLLLKVVERLVQNPCWALWYSRCSPREHVLSPTFWRFQAGLKHNTVKRTTPDLAWVRAVEVPNETNAASADYRTTRAPAWPISGSEHLLLCVLEA